MTKWAYRINAVVPDALHPLLSALWTIIAPEGDPEALSFSVPLSATGQNPPTHWGMSTAATEEMRLLIVELFGAELTGLHTSITSYLANDWADILALNGLQELSNG